MLTFIILAEEEHGPANGVHFGADTNEIIWGTIGFLVIMGVLAKYAGPAVKKGLAGRTSRIEAELADAKTARNAAEAALNESAADLPDIDVEADRIRSEAVETASRLKADMIAKAKVEADSVRTRGASDIESSKRQAMADLTDEVARMTRGATEAIVLESLDADSHGKLIDNYIDKVGQL